MKLFRGLFVVLAVWFVNVAQARLDYDDRMVGEVEVMVNNRTHDFNVSVVGEEWENDYMSGRFGVGVLGVRKEEGIYGAAVGGIRFSLPFVVSPFVGFGMIIGRGYDRDSEVRYDRDHESTNGRNEDGRLYGYIVACYPEAGVRLWLGKQASLAGSMRYFVSSAGRSSDCFMYGGSINVRF